MVLLTAVIDRFCRSILGWTFTRRCRAADVIPAMERAWSQAFPGGGLDQDLCQGVRVDIADLSFIPIGD